MFKNRPWMVLLVLLVSSGPLLHPAGAQDAKTLLPTLELPAAEVRFNTAHFQAALAPQTALGPLVTAHSTLGDQAIAFGFAAKSPDAKFFLLGTLYAEALAYLHSGDLERAARRLEAIEQELIALHVPSALYRYLSTVRNVLETQRYGDKAAAEFLALFEPLYEEYAARQGVDKLTLFRAGAWAVNLSLAAAAEAKGMLQQGDKVQYFLTALQGMQAPKGVLEALTQLQQLASKAELTERDVQEVLKLVQQMQTLLS